MFVEAYLGESNGNASDAARRAGYSCCDVAGSRLLVNVSIRVAIDAQLDEASLKTNEILGRLSDMACADAADFITISKTGWSLDLQKAKRAGRTHLIKRLKSTQWGTALELHDSQAALEKLARYRGLFVDRSPAEPVAETIDVPCRILLPLTDDRFPPRED